MTNIKERVKTLWDRNSMLLKGLLKFQYHFKIYMNKIKQLEGSATPLGITCRISAIEKLTQSFEAE